MAVSHNKFIDNFDISDGFLNVNVPDYPHFDHAPQWLTENTNVHSICLNLFD